VTALDASTTFASFDEYWRPFSADRDRPRLRGLARWNLERRACEIGYESAFRSGRPDRFH